jgi:hypothetical protein
MKPGDEIMLLVSRWSTQRWQVFADHHGRALGDMQATR